MGMDITGMGITVMRDMDTGAMSMEMKSTDTDTYITAMRNMGITNVRITGMRNIGTGTTAMGSMGITSVRITGMMNMGTRITRMSITAMGGMM